MSGHIWPWGFWCRITDNGWGLSVIRRRKRDALYSERRGHRLIAYALGFRFEVLRPIRPPIMTVNEP